MRDGTPTPRDVVVAAYQWESGRCYRCGVDADRTAVVGRLPRRGLDVLVRACEECTVYLERDREQAAARYGWPYVPGDLSP
nr:hypothetical protein KPHV_61060 [Kitasatospora purpeofusca]